MRLSAFLFFFLIISVSQVMGIGKVRRTNNFQSYKDPIYELGYSTNISYLKYEATFSPQLSLYYKRNVSGFFAIGAGYNAIFDEHFHNTLHLITSFRLYRELFVSINPGLVFKSYRGRAQTLYSLGFSTNYQMNISEKIHVGPKAEVVVAQDDMNYLLGFNMGLSF